MSPLSAHLAYGAAWLSFAVGHSLMAGEGLTRWFGKYTRLIYNLFAAVHLGAVLVVGGLMLDRSVPVLVGGFWSPVLSGVEIVGAVIFLLSLRDYDLGLLSGFKQIRLGAGVGLDEPNLNLKGLHRYVRHPIYTGAFLLLWGGATYEVEMATAVWGSLYLLAGTYFEERRLLRRFGGAYRDYRRAVPAYIPWKGRLTIEDHDDQ